MHKSLTIAGSDSSGGAGIQADLKTMTVLGVYGMSAITALTAQNTTGVQSIFEVAPKFLEDELDSIFTDIFPDSVKIGMVSNAELIRVISKKLREYNAKNIVVDPVMVSTSGSKLMADGAKDTLLSELFKVADIITPNIPEAEVLTGQSIKSKDDMVEAAKKIGEFFDGYILLKGGHSTKDDDDLLYKNSEKIWIKGERIENPNTHGTGCTLSSAIASYLAMGHDVPESVHLAKEFISGAISAKLDLGKGRGPLNHMWKMGSENL
ncbi:bifunctional hydroxymethylpyrimidine kinase/phosphomethylpyrimidine kinase [Ezakiella coagulans]|uniref:bifunctional hydroxymethylpyrimidine kinase/phosphomethylpyrimidine kinase n=1 Tax=Ezakiella coagulans TaxID=46507 RepID=UPI002014DE94|nr:bifunctional hydroxymethylpyrimidine kinase/phosphomethylpyrimidine kinase [Ezakiella coagulans]UQK60038.1 bifunctional hydroxymethylpyrimidine kinase/phosphomethylpyrimidine kinase [Ezakiella coagulans]